MSSCQGLPGSRRSQAHPREECRDPGSIPLAVPLLLPWLLGKCEYHNVVLQAVDKRGARDRGYGPCLTLTWWDQDTTPAQAEPLPVTSFKALRCETLLLHTLRILPALVCASGIMPSLPALVE